MALNTVPKSGETLNATRDPIRNNFTSIDTGFSVDHEEFTVPSGGNAGKHKGIHIIDGTPNPAVASTEIGVYNTVTGGVPALILKAGSSSAVDITTAVTSSPGYCRLASGILVKWGTALSPASNSFGSQSFNSGGIPNFSATPFFLNVSTTFQTGSGVDTSSPRSLIITSGPDSAPAHVMTKDQFWVFHRAITGSPSAVTYFWIALGLG